MPYAMADDVRAFVARIPKCDLVVQESPISATGYTNVIEIEGKYQARLQVKGDGRGGVRKRKQYTRSRASLTQRSKRRSISPS